MATSQVTLGHISQKRTMIPPSPTQALQLALQIGNVPQQRVAQASTLHPIEIEGLPQQPLLDGRDVFFQVQAFLRQFVERRRGRGAEQRGAVQT